MSAQGPSDDRLYFQHHVFVCTNQRAADDPRGCCWAKGSVALRNYMKQRASELGLDRTRINIAGCLDRCELGPTVVIYPEGVWYTISSKADVDEILDRHLTKGQLVERLRMPLTQAVEG